MTATIKRDDRLLNFRDVLLLYGIPQGTMKRYRHEGVMEFVELGRNVYVRERSLVDFIDRHSTAAVSNAPACVGVM